MFGIHTQYVSRVFVITKSDSPGGTVLLLTWYAEGTGAMIACNDFEVGQRGLCFSLIELISQKITYLRYLEFSELSFPQKRILLGNIIHSTSFQLVKLNGIEIFSLRTSLQLQSKRICDIIFLRRKKEMSMKKYHASTSTQNYGL